MPLKDSVFNQASSPRKLMVTRGFTSNYLEAWLVGYFLVKMYWIYGRFSHTPACLQHTATNSERRLFQINRK